jgi:hypothetical protein
MYECSSTYYIPAVPKNESLIGRPLMAKGKLVDKCKNMLYKSDDKHYVRKRKCSSETSSDEREEKIFDKGKLEIKAIKNKIVIRHVIGITKL